MYETKEYFRALADLDRIEKEKPDTAAVYFLRGLVLTKMRNYPDALQAFEAAMEKDPANKVECLVNQATVKFYMRKYDEAEQELNAAALLKSDEANIFNTLAMIQAERGQFTIALDNVNKALQIEPEQPYFLNNRGYINMGLKKMSEAEADLNRSMSIDPYNGWVYRNKGIFYLQQQDGASAERLLLQALDRDGFTDQIHFYLGSAYLLQGKRNDACAQFRLSVEMGEQKVTDAMRKDCNI